jgi:hypothetical protein
MYPLPGHTKQKSKSVESSTSPAQTLSEYNKETIKQLALTFFFTMQINMSNEDCLGFARDKVVKQILGFTPLSSYPEITLQEFFFYLTVSKLSQSDKIKFIIKSLIAIKMLLAQFFQPLSKKEEDRTSQVKMINKLMNEYSIFLHTPKLDIVYFGVPTEESSAEKQFQSTWFHTPTLIDYLLKYNQTLLEKAFDFFRSSPPYAKTDSKKFNYLYQSSVDLNNPFKLSYLYLEENLETAETFEELTTLPLLSL